MSTEHDSSQTYGDMLGIAARVMGDEIRDFDTGKLLPPDDDPVSLENAKSVVTNAIRRVVGSDKHWTWLRRMLTLDLNSNGKDVYVMPWWFSRPLVEAWRYTGTNGPIRMIRIVSESILLEITSGNETIGSGDPRICVFKTRRGKKGTRPRIVAHFWPKPAAARTIEVPVRPSYERLHDMNDLFFAPRDLDLLMELAIEYEASRFIKRGDREERLRDFKEELGSAIVNDRAKRPRTFGRTSRAFGHRINRLDHDHFDWHTHDGPITDPTGQVVN